MLPTFSLKRHSPRFAQLKRSANRSQRTARSSRASLSPAAETKTRNPSGSECTALAPPLRLRTGSWLEQTAGRQACLDPKDREAKPVAGGRLWRLGQGQGPGKKFVASPVRGPDWPIQELTHLEQIDHLGRPGHRASGSLAVVQAEDVASVKMIIHLGCISCGQLCASQEDPVWRNQSMMLGFDKHM